MYDICSAIIELTKDSETGTASVSVKSEDYEQITWHDSNPNNITVDQIKAKQAELKADYDSMNYSRRRKAEYPPLEDVTIALAEKAEGRSEMWDEITAKRATVRTKYPKP